MNFIAQLPEECKLVPWESVPIGAWFREDLKGEMLRSTWQKVSKTMSSDGQSALESHHEYVWLVTNYMNPDRIRLESQGQA